MTDSTPKPEQGKTPLRTAMQSARIEAAERSAVVVELRDAEAARLEMLNDALDPVFAEIPPEHLNFFDRGISAGTQPRLWIDMVAHVAMGRDKRTYRLLQDTIHGRRVLAESLDVLRDGNKRLPLDGFKIPHHGSVANLSEALLEKIACKHYLISTSGARFRHPHARAVQLLLDAHRHRAKPRLHFNYLTTTTERWSEQNQNGDYVAFHPSGISLDL